jgi:hypothetical protein
MRGCADLQMCSSTGEIDRLIRQAGFKHDGKRKNKKRVKRHCIYESLRPD